MASSVLNGDYGLDILFSLERRLRTFAAAALAHGARRCDHRDALAHRGIRSDLQHPLAVLRRAGAPLARALRPDGPRHTVAAAARDGPPDLFDRQLGTGVAGVYAACRDRIAARATLCDLVCVDRRVFDRGLCGNHCSRYGDDAERLAGTDRALASSGAADV